MNHALGGYASRFASAPASPGSSPVSDSPRARSFQQFVDESRSHGGPSFRDNEGNWDQVRVLDGGETVSVAGTHLGHNIPDHHGNRYCINLVCVAGRPKEQIK